MQCTDNSSVQQCTVQSMQCSSDVPFKTLIVTIINLTRIFSVTELTLLMKLHYFCSFGAVLDGHPTGLNLLDRFTTAP